MPPPGRERSSARTTDSVRPSTVSRTLADAARMIEETGCHGVAVGRGALANPWFFRQLSGWVETGDPGPRATYRERVEFMDRHLRRLCEWRGGERWGCTRQVARLADLLRAAPAA